MWGFKTGLRDKEAKKMPPNRSLFAAKLIWPWYNHFTYLVSLGEFEGDGGEIVFASIMEPLWEEWDGRD